MTEAHQANARATYFKGLAIATIGVVAFSFDALLIRMSGVGGFQAAFWRAMFPGIALTLVFFIKNRGNAVPLLKSGGRPLLTSGILWGLSGLGFTMGVQTAGAANTLVLFSLAPLFAATFSFIAYRQKPSFVTILAIFAAIGGIYYIYHDGIGNISPSGMLFAISAPALLGSNLSILRRNPQVSRIAASMIGGFVGATISFLVTGGMVAIPIQSLIPLLILGLFILPFGQTMISTGTRYIPAAESALINSLETVLGITYVWIILGETPTIDFIIGAAVVMLSITANSLYQARIRKES